MFNDIVAAERPATLNSPYGVTFADLYTVEGAVALFYGNELEHVAVLAEGSFCYIPPDVPHKAYNLSETHASRFVSARNDPDDPENVVVTPTADDGSSDERARELRKRFAAGGV